jgi:hypothetical protein
MMMSWVLFTGLATMIARYFKRSFGEKKVCGVKVWFQVIISEYHIDDLL